MTPLKYLDLSTGHLLRRTIEDVGQPYMIAEYEYGAFFYVPEEVEPDTPEDLVRVLDYARANGCTLIRLDSDGGIIEDLPYYEW